MTAVGWAGPEWSLQPDIAAIMTAATNAATVVFALRPTGQTLAVEGDRP
jgi:hypothetical protein